MQEKSSIKNKEFRQAVAESSGYNLYEVNDILEHTAIVLARLLQDNAEVKVKGIGTFKKKPPYLRKFKSKISGQEHTIYTKTTISLTIDSFMGNMLNTLSTETTSDGEENAK